MNIKSFIKDKILSIALLLFAIITSEIFLIPYPMGSFIKIYIPVAIFVAYTIGLSIEYITKKSYYSKLTNMLDELEEKYLITEIINTPNFVEGKILKDTLQEINKAMLEHVNHYKYLRRGL